MLRSARPVGRILRILATNTFAAAVYALLLGSLVGWRSMLTYFLISFIYASVIGTAAHLIMPLVGARLSGGAPAVYWLRPAAPPPRLPPARSFPSPLPAPRLA